MSFSLKRPNTVRFLLILERCRLQQFIAVHLRFSSSSSWIHSKVPFPASLAVRSDHGTEIWAMGCQWKWCVLLLGRAHKNLVLGAPPCACSLWANCKGGTYRAMDRSPVVKVAEFPTAWVPCASAWIKPTGGPFCSPRNVPGEISELLFSHYTSLGSNVRRGSVYHN